MCGGWGGQIPGNGRSPQSHVGDRWRPPATSTHRGALLVTLDGAERPGGWWLDVRQSRLITDNSEPTVRQTHAQGL